MVTAKGLIDTLLIHTVLSSYMHELLDILECIWELVIPNGKTKGSFWMPLLVVIVTIGFISISLWMMYF
jgi:hypothetical protein